jgi:hypothetical protein
VVIHPQGITITWMRPGRSLIRASCRGLSPTEHGPVVAVAFDTVRKYKAYVLTASGQLLTMVIPFGKQTHICRVSTGSPGNPQPFPTTWCLCAVCIHVSRCALWGCGGGGEVSIVWGRSQGVGEVSTTAPCSQQAPGQCAVFCPLLHIPCIMHIRGRAQPLECIGRAYHHKCSLLSCLT